jgi:integrase
MLAGGELRNLLRSIGRVDGNTPRNITKHNSKACENEMEPRKRNGERKVALKKRGKTWHTHFFVDGQRFRQSLETSDWREAQAKEKVLISAASQGKLRASSEDFARLPFEDAVEKYLANRLPELAEQSQKKELQLLVKLKKHFRGRRLRTIEADDVLAYRQWRASQGVGASMINMEVGVIRRMLKRAKRWSLIADDVRPLRGGTSSIGKALTTDEKMRLLRVSEARPEWQTARLAMTLALCTTMRGIEIKCLRWRDVDLLRRSFTIRRSKTAAGLRSIPMNEDAYGAVMELWGRASAFRGTQPEHYIFPACENGQMDPERHQRSWRTAWRSMTRAILCPQCREFQDPAKNCRVCEAEMTEIKSPLAGLRFHDLRHHAITELAESQTSDSTIMSLAGHVSRKMLEHYSHVRQDAKRDAVNLLSARRPNRPTLGGCDTNHDTNIIQQDRVQSYVVEINGRDD